MTKSSDPDEDSAVQTELNAIIKRTDSPIRYAVVFALTKHSNGFYDFSTGLWIWNSISETALLKDREIAEAAATILTSQRQQKCKKSVIFPGTSRPLQTVSLRKVRDRWAILRRVRGRHESYIPNLQQGGP